MELPMDRIIRDAEEKSRTDLEKKAAQEGLDEAYFGLVAGILSESKKVQESYHANMKALIREYNSRIDLTDRANILPLMQKSYEMARREHKG